MSDFNEHIGTYIDGEIVSLADMENAVRENKALRAQLADAREALRSIASVAPSLAHDGGWALKFIDIAAAALKELEGKNGEKI